MKPARVLAYEQFPSWITNPNSWRYRYPIYLTADALLQKCLDGVMHRYPNAVNSETLSRLGAQAGLSRSPFHDDETYAARLRQRVQLNKQKGSSEALIREVKRWFGAEQWNSIQMLNGKRTRLTILPDESLHYDEWAWNDSPLWCRAYILVFRDSLLTAPQLQSLQQLCTEFKSAPVAGQLTIHTTTSELWSEIPAPAALPGWQWPPAGSPGSGQWSESGENWSSPAASTQTFTF